MESYLIEVNGREYEMLVFGLATLIGQEINEGGIFEPEYEDVTRRLLARLRRNLITLGILPEAKMRPM